MSDKINNNGRAYEFAFLNELVLKIKNFVSCEVVKNKSYFTNQKAYLHNDNKAVLLRSSKATLCEILRIEPNLTDNTEKLLISFQDDSKGKKADVRDIVINCEKIDYEIGFSLKHNHKAVKHSRLSDKIDFAKEWYGGECSKLYWECITLIFQFLKEHKGESWQIIEDKNNKIYKPLLCAFKEEIQNINERQVKDLCRYLIGYYDFYKIISIDKEKCTYVQTFNFDNNLGKDSKNKKSAIKIPILDLPNKILYCDLDGENKVILCLNKGWQFSFRIHNASSKIEASLKFDINLVGIPPNILNIKCVWVD